MSVVICTRDRAELLPLGLESLCRQSLGQEAFEVVVVDDGSKDATREVCRAFEPRLPLRYSHQRAAGIATARNHGVFLARGAIVLFLDDDRADPALLEEHLATHRRFPEPRFGVRGETRLDSAIARDPLMRFVAEVAPFRPFSSPGGAAGMLLDSSHFSAGRSSCKRSFLVERGMFDPVFRSAWEDVELAWRLSGAGFEVVSNPRAVSAAARAVGVDEFCERQYVEGQSGVVFSRMHPDASPQPWTEVASAAEEWRALAPAYDGILRSARELDRIVRTRLDEELPVGESELTLLHRSYLAAFRASRVKGTFDAGARGSATAAPALATA